MAFGGVDLSGFAGNSFLGPTSGLLPYIPPATTLQFTSGAAPDAATTVAGSKSTLQSIADVISSLGTVAIGGILASRMPAGSITQPTTVVTTPSGTTTTTPTLPGTVTIAGVTANKTMLYIAIALLILAGVLYMLKKQGA